MRLLICEQACRAERWLATRQGMVKYATNITRESIVDVEGMVAVPDSPVEACTQSKVPCSLPKLLRMAMPEQVKIGCSPCHHQPATLTADSSRLGVRRRWS